MQGVSIFWILWWVDVGEGRITNLEEPGHTRTHTHVPSSSSIIPWAVRMEWKWEEVEGWTVSIGQRRCVHTHVPCRVMFIQTETCWPYRGIEISSVLDPCKHPSKLRGCDHRLLILSNVHMIWCFKESVLYAKRGHTRLDSKIKPDQTESTFDIGAQTGPP